MIIFSDEEGKSNLVYLRDMANKILSDSWYKSRNSNISEEKRRIIMAAASLLRDDIQSATFDSEYYPSDVDITAGKDFLPPLLKYFMESLISSELKQAALGQCLLKAVKPKNVIPPLLFALAAEIDYTVGVKALLTTACRLGPKIQTVCSNGQLQW